MTENEAIKILKRDLAIQKNNKALPDGIAAMEMAIKALEEIKTYKNAEKQGLLLKLRCKVGDIMWYPIEQCNEVVEVEVIEIQYTSVDERTETRIFSRNNKNWEYFEDDASKFFSTKKEAEASLEEILEKEQDR